ncbi:hypothetical protein PVK06_039304 [Gossypium arboreum]|uniref:Retrotransposon Copia-like N-terminal domain-containing protein n=1 Tax=Gossypium arboreum TaxID=29729 RepID=A0ABR0N4L0_GOSAR|nr:hypothetical protein PVK06_039304 [Gossypium arboreum]
MTTTASTDSTAINPGSSAFTGTRLVQSFSRHETIKLDEDTFVHWQQHVRMIVEGYELIGFLDGTLASPLWFVQSLDGSLIPNSDSSTFVQQDRLLVFDMICFLSRKAVFQSKFVAKIQNMSALITVSGSCISEEEKVQTLHVGLPSDFDSVITLASFSSEPLRFQQLVEVLLEFENRQGVLFVVFVPHLEVVGVGSDPEFNAKSADGLGIFLNGVSIVTTVTMRDRRRMLEHRLR